MAAATLHRRIYHYGGRVQGVGFRYTVKNIAMPYNVQGYVKNLPDGRVEAFCMGHASAGPLLVCVAHKGAQLFDIEKFQVIPLPSEGREDRWP